MACFGFPSLLVAFSLAPLWKALSPYGVQGRAAAARLGGPIFFLFLCTDSAAAATSSRISLRGAQLGRHPQAPSSYGGFCYFAFLLGRVNSIYTYTYAANGTNTQLRTPPPHPPRRHRDLNSPRSPLLHPARRYFNQSTNPSDRAAAARVVVVVVALLLFVGGLGRLHHRRRRRGRRVA